MEDRVTTITLRQPWFLDDVNCYLIQAEGGTILVDTGPPRQRATLVAELAAAGCTPGTLSLILLTHGDFDHCGNAAYLKQTYGAPLAMHAGDLDMLARGKLCANRKCGLKMRLVALLGPLFVGFGRDERCTPSLTLEDGDNLAAYGLDEQVLALGGHSAGSLGLQLGADAGGLGGDLFCGDLLGNVKGPAKSGLMPDPEAADASIARLRAMSIQTVYPGHGAPFQLSELTGMAPPPTS